MHCTLSTSPVKSHSEIYFEVTVEVGAIINFYYGRKYSFRFQLATKKLQSVEHVFHELFGQATVDNFKAVSIYSSHAHRQVPQADDPMRNDNSR